MIWPYNFCFCSTAEWNISNTAERGSERCRRQVPRTARFRSVRRRTARRRVPTGTTTFTRRRWREAGCHARAGWARAWTGGAQPTDARGGRVPLAAGPAACAARAGRVAARAAPRARARARAGLAATAGAHRGPDGVRRRRRRPLHSRGPADLARRTLWRRAGLGGGDVVFICTKKIV